MSQSHRKGNGVFHAVKSMFASAPRNRQVMPYPLNANSPWYFTAGPVFTPGADGAILNSKLSKPWQVLQGYAYRVAHPQKYTATQPQQLFAPKGVPTVGINIQLAQNEIFSPSVNSDGTFADQGIFASTGTLPDYGAGVNTTEYPDYS